MIRMNETAMAGGDERTASGGTEKVATSHVRDTGPTELLERTRVCTCKLSGSIPPIKILLTCFVCGRSQRLNILTDELLNFDESACPADPEARRYRVEIASVIRMQKGSMYK